MDLTLGLCQFIKFKLFGKHHYTEFLMHNLMCIMSFNILLTDLKLKSVDKESKTFHERFHNTFWHLCFLRKQSLETI